MLKKSQFSNLAIEREKREKERKAEREWETAKETERGYPSPLVSGALKGLLLLPSHSCRLQRFDSVYLIAGR
jgi:hypothetical protein